MPYETKYDEALGKCKFCDAPMVKNPKTGKVFCSEKCWLKKSDAMQTSADPQTARITQFQDNKEASMRIMSSGRDATLMVTSMMQQGAAWNEQQLQEEIEKWQKFFHDKIYISKPF